RQSSFGIPLFQMDFQNIECFLIGKNKILLKSVLLLSIQSHSPFARSKNLNGIYFARLGYFRKIGLERICERQLKAGALHYLSLEHSLHYHPIDLVFFGVVLVVAYLVSDK